MRPVHGVWRPAARSVPRWLVPRDPVPRCCSSSTEPFHLAQVTGELAFGVLRRPRRLCAELAQRDHAQQLSASLGGTGQEGATPAIGTVPRVVDLSSQLRAELGLFVEEPADALETRGARVAHEAWRTGLHEIGRASCRERV